MSDFARKAAEAAGINLDEAPPEIGRFPRDFWDARPLFKHVEQTALSRLVVSPEALLVTVLGHISTHIPAAINLPGPPRNAPPNLLMCIVGHPGKAKGAVFDAANSVLPPPLTAVRHNLGTAQGLAKSFYRKGDAENGDAPKGTWFRHYEPVIFRMDEIGTLAGLVGSRSGAGELLLSELKHSFSGERLGFDYATEDKRFPVEPFSYRLLGLFGVAPDKAAPLFSDAGGGTPDRLLFVTVRASEKASLDHPDDPGRYPWKMPPLIDRMSLFGVAPSVEQRINEGLLWRARTDQPTTEFEAHIDLQQKKLGAPLAVSEGRWDITEDDYELAGVVITAHREMRDFVIDRIESEAKRRHESTTRMMIARTAALDEDREKRDAVRRLKRTSEGALKLAVKVHQRGQMTRKDARTEMKNYRDILEDVIELALQHKWIAEERTVSHTGSVRRLLIPGSVEPQ